MISKIVLNGVASYKKEAVLDTDKKVNLLYGLNGTGKSTFSEFLYDQTGARFSQCSIEGLEENDTVLVTIKNLFRIPFTNQREYMVYSPYRREMLKLKR